MRKTPLHMEKGKLSLRPAERVGFEPTVTHKATTVFETVPFNRSGTSTNSGAIISQISMLAYKSGWTNWLGSIGCDLSFMGIAWTTWSGRRLN